MQITHTIPVLPSANIEKDVAWYKNVFGFNALFADNMYAVLQLNDSIIHLQWHADTPKDPLLGGSVVRLVVDDITPIYNDLLDRGLIEPIQFARKTAWQTDEIGIYDLNRNAIFIVQWL